MISMAWFLFKISVFTVATLAALQIRIGNKSVDGHLTHWLQQYKIETRVKDVVRSSTQFVHRMRNRSTKSLQLDAEKQKKLSNQSP